MALLALGFATVTDLYDMQYVFSTAMSWTEQTTIFVMLGVALLAVAALWAQRMPRRAAS